MFTIAYGKQRNRTFRWVAGFILVLLAAGIVYYYPLLFSKSAEPLRVEDVVRRASLNKSDQDFVSLPHIIIPSIGVSSSLDPVGNEKNGNLDVPADGTRVGWYKYGTKPGDVGTAVVTGHVDAGRNPGVFRFLKNLQVGEQIVILTEDRQKLTYEVKETVKYSIDDAPLQKIFGLSDNKRLNLITCEGLWNPFRWQYDHRRVVFTQLIDESAL